MISRRALFAGAAGAVVAASPVARAVAAPATGTAMRVMGWDLAAPGGDVTVLFTMQDWQREILAPMIRELEWSTPAELLEEYPNAD